MVKSLPRKQKIQSHSAVRVLTELLGREGERRPCEYGFEAPSLDMLLNCVCHIIYALNHLKKIGVPGESEVLYGLIREADLIKAIAQRWQYFEDHI